MPNASDFIPSLTGGTTTALALDQGYSYNQSGLTYNQSNVDYGGLYKVDQSFAPILSMAKDSIPSLFVQDTLEKQIDQGYSYNQSGFSYSQAGVDYGGVYNLFDIMPLISLAKEIFPTFTIQSDWTNTFDNPNKHILLEDGSDLLLENGQNFLLEG